MSNVETLLSELKSFYPQIERKVYENVPFYAVFAYDGLADKTNITATCPFCSKDFTRSLNHRRSSLYMYDGDNCPHCGASLSGRHATSDQSFSTSDRVYVFFPTTLGDTGFAVMSYSYTYEYSTKVPLVETSQNTVEMIGFLDYGNREIYKLENGNYKKTAAFKSLKSKWLPVFSFVKEALGTPCPGSSRRVLFANLAKLSEPQQTSTGTQRTSKKVPKKFTPSALTEEDISPFATQVLSDDLTAKVIKTEVWCTHCGHIFENTFNYSNEYNANITCPDCSTEGKISLLQMKNGSTDTKSFLQVIDKGDCYDIIRVTGYLDSNWNVFQSSYPYAISVDKKTGKISYFKEKNDGTYGSKKNAVNFGADKLICYSDTGLDILLGDSKPDTFVISEYLNELVRFPHLKDVLKKNPGFAPYLKKTIVYGFQTDLSKQTPEEILGLTKEIYDALTPEADIRDLCLWASHFPGIAKEDADFLVQYSIHPGNLLVTTLKDSNLSVHSLIEYLEKVKDEQYIYPSTAASIWLNYVALSKKNNVMFTTEDDVFPASLKLAYDKVYFELYGRYS